MTDNNKAAAAAATISPSAVLAEICMARFDASVRRYLILAHQVNWAKETNAANNLLPPHQRRGPVAPSDCPLKAEPLGLKPPTLADDPTAIARLRASVVAWCAGPGQEDVSWHELNAVLEDYLTALPADLPDEVSATRIRAEWHNLRQPNPMQPINVQQPPIAFSFMFKHLQLLATFALAEKSVRTKDDEDSYDVPVNLYMVLAREMAHNEDLITLCERVAGNVARPIDLEEMLSYVPCKMRAVPGQVAWEIVPEPGRTPLSATMYNMRKMGQVQDLIREWTASDQEEKRADERLGMTLSEEDEVTVGDFFDFGAFE